MTIEQILRSHERWLQTGDGERADFRGMDLRKFPTGVHNNLAYALLDGANIEGADFSGVDFAYASLKEVNARGTKLQDGGFYRADLTGARLQSADLSGADLRFAVRYRALFNDANVDGALGLAASAYLASNDRYDWIVGTEPLVPGVHWWEEAFEPDPRVLLGGGYIVASQHWWRIHLREEELPFQPVRIPSRAQIVEPYGADGFVRTDGIEVLAIPAPSSFQPLQRGRH